MKMQMDQLQAQSQQQLNNNNMQVDQEMQTPANQDGFFVDLSPNSQAACSVRVALRVRPLLPREIYENSRICVDVNSDQNQVVIGKDRCFTFDKSFDLVQSQEDVFEICVKNLVLGCFSGFNATVLAYGQTGSGKTYTMGSGFTLGVKEEDLGIIPRVIRLIFEEEEKRRSKAEFIIKCSFLEIYNEELIDLLDQGFVDKMIPHKKEITIREEKNGTISVYGLNEVTVRSSDEMGNCLDIGSHARRTASTLMNQASSRSHGIFTITIEQHLIEDLIGETSEVQLEPKPNEFTVAKFHFVDLAGSERAKKTGATGSILKEGININKSLLALGNVISALTDDQKKGTHHIPYRDSKLTRILQDSLGGNSRTSMIACVSPAETSYEETLNTLKYASRARNIKNKPVVNRDPASQQILSLRQSVYELQKELVTMRKLLVQNGIQFEAQIEVDSNNFDDFQHLTAHPARSNNDRVLDAIISDLKKQLQQRDHQVVQLQSQCSEMQAHNDQVEIAQFDHMKQRDEARLLTEHLQQRLKDLGHPTDFSKLAMPTGSTSVIEEYRTNTKALEKDALQMKQMLTLLQVDNQQLIEQAARDTKSLEARQVDLDQLKRTNEILKSEVNRLGQDLKKASSVKPQSSRLSQVPFKNSFINQGTTWLSTDLDHKIKHFDDIRQRFIENLGNQMSSLLAVNTPRSSAMSQVEGGVATGDQQISSQEDSQDDDSADDAEVQPSDEEGGYDRIPDDSDVTMQHQPQQQDQLPIGDPSKIILEEQLLQQQQQHLFSLDSQLKDKEALLTNFKLTQKELQDSLLQAMKEEYHKRVESLQKELVRLEHQKTTEMTKTVSQQQRSKLEDSYRAKQAELQAQLQTIARKDLQTKQMQKDLSEQQRKVKTLESDLQTMKTNKVIMMKKVKDDQEKLNKYKMEQQRELQKLKSHIAKKERENTELKRNANKKEIFAKRKVEELTAIQQRQRQDQMKKKNATKQRQSLKQVDLDQIKNWIIENTLKMLRYKEMHAEQETRNQEFKQVDNEIQSLQAQHAKLTIQQERVDQQLQMQNDPSQAQNLEALSHSYRQQAEELREQLEILDSKQRFVNSQILQLIRQLESMRPDPIDSKVIQNVQSLEGARACISIFFQLLLEANLVRLEVEKDCDFKQAELDQNQHSVTELRQLVDGTHRKHLQALKEIEQAYKQREKNLFDVVVQKTGVDSSEIENGDLLKLFQVCFTSGNKQLIHLGTDNLGINKHAVAQINRSVDQQTRVTQKAPPVSLKDARNARKIKKAEQETEQTVDQVSTNEEALNRLKQQSHLKRSTIQSIDLTDEQVLQNSSWHVLADKQDAHKTSVVALANLEHNLYSSASKSLKIWDIEGMNLVSELSDTGVVKAIAISKSRRLLIVAADRSIVMWDLVGLTKVSSFQAPNEIKCIELIEEQDMLFAGTKGTATTGSLLIFDLKSSTRQPVDQKEYNQDVSSLAATSQCLFLGSRQQINPFDFRQWQTMAPLGAHHTDSITSLVALPYTNSLVSGSKDRSLRSYICTNAAQQVYEDQYSVVNAHTDHITCMRETGEGGFYTGSRDGLVKEWTHDLKCTAQLEGSNPSSSLSGGVSSVNSICKLDSQIYGRAFACANSDKSIRIWRQADSSVEANQKMQHVGAEQEPSPGGVGRGSALSQLMSFKQRKKQERSGPN